MAINKAIKPVQNVEPTRDLQSKTAALVADTSTTLATILGVAVSAQARGVELYITGTGSVHYNPTGAATTSHAIIPANKTIFGNKTELDALQIIGGSGETPVINAIVFGDK
jgi:hypothetical protein